jgi:hypothetical protein
MRHTISEIAEEVGGFNPATRKELFFGLRLAERM